MFRVVQSTSITRAVQIDPDWESITKLGTYFDLGAPSSSTGRSVVARISCPTLSSSTSPSPRTMLPPLDLETSGRWGRCPRCLSRETLDPRLAEVCPRLRWCSGPAGSPRCCPCTCSSPPGCFAWAGRGWGRALRGQTADQATSLKMLLDWRRGLPRRREGCSRENLPLLPSSRSTAARSPAGRASCRCCSYHFQKKRHWKHSPGWRASSSWGIACCSNLEELWHLLHFLQPLPPRPAVARSPRSTVRFSWAYLW